MRLQGISIAAFAAALLLPMSVYSFGVSPCQSTSTTTTAGFSLASTAAGQNLDVEIDIGNLVEMTENLQYEETDTRKVNNVTAKIAAAIDKDDLAEARQLCDEVQGHFGLEWRSAVLEAHCHEKFAHTDAAAEAEKWIRLTPTSVNNVSHTVMYNQVMKAWRVSSDPSATRRAAALLTRMEQMGRVDAFSYSTFVSILAKGGSVQDALEVLSRMKENGVKVNAHILGTVINACVQGDCVEMADDLLKRMEAEYLKGRESIAPCVVSYSTVMKGYAKKRNLDLSQVEDTFQRMQNMCTNHGNEEARPNIISYVTLISAMCQAGVPRRAEKMLRTMMELHRQNPEVNPKPNTQLVATVIDAWQKSNERNPGLRAERLLEWMIEEYQKDGDKSIQPNVFTFAAAIKAWAVSNKYGKADRARTLLVRMRKLNERGIVASPPNAYCYAAALNACAFCKHDDKGRSRALTIAVTTYQEMLQSSNDVLNDVSFSTMISAVWYLSPPSDKRDNAITAVFNKCIEMGWVSNNVLQKVQNALSKEQAIELVGARAVRPDGTVDITLLPKDWTRNALKSTRRRSPARANVSP